MAYDSSISSFTTKTNKVDLVDAAHINSVQSELVVIETILGTGIKGTSASLSARLNKAIDSDGSILSGTSFPSPSLPSQGFYRTDLDVFYIMNAANSAWLAQGGSLSNVIFCWTGMVNSDASASAYIGTSLTAPTTKNYMYLWSTGGTTYKELLASKWRRISGVTTLTVYCQIWQANTNTVNCKVDVGGQSGNIDGTASQTTPEWKSFSIDVSSLLTDTVYDLSVQIKQNNANGQYLLLGAIIIFGS